MSFQLGREMRRHEALGFPVKTLEEFRHFFPSKLLLLAAQSKYSFQLRLKKNKGPFP